jgi:hypothetical protein
MWVRSTHAVSTREIKMGFRPLPALSRPQRVSLAAELCGYQQIEQRHIFQIVVQGIDPFEVFGVQRVLGPYPP